VRGCPWSRSPRKLWRAILNLDSNRGTCGKIPPESPDIIRKEQKRPRGFPRGL
jgi:hypothetical protein